MPAASLDAAPRRRAGGRCAMQALQTSGLRSLLWLAVAACGFFAPPVYGQERALSPNAAPGGWPVPTAPAVTLGSTATTSSGGERASSFQDKLLEQAMNVRLHGFVSQGYLLSSDNNYLAASKKGSFEFSEVGLNVTAPLSDRARLGIQFFAQDLGPLGNYSAKLDWFYLDYRWRDWLGLRFGRVKLPFGLYNDIQDVDAARNAALLPQSVYPWTDRELLLAQTGMEVYGFVDLHEVGGLEYRLFAGTIFRELVNTPTTRVLSQNVPYVVGGRLMWDTPVPGLRVGASALVNRTESVLLLGNSSTPTSSDVDAVLAVASAEYVIGDFNAAAEYSRWYTNTVSGDASLNRHVTSERGYVMSSYRLSNWFQPGAYYSLLYPNVDNRSAPAQQQHDFAATLRFDLTSFWLLKLEGHYMYGTAALDPALNGNAPLASLAPSWGLLVLKTTAYF